MFGAPALGAGNLWQPIVTVIGTGVTLSEPLPGSACELFTADDVTLP